MRLGIGSYTYGWAVAQPGGLSALGLLDRAVRLGVGVVQLCDNLPAETWSDENVVSLANRASTLGLSLEVGTRGCQTAHLRRFLGIAQRLGSPILRLVIDTADDRPSAAEILARWAPLLPEFEQAGVALAIENHDRFTCEELLGLVYQMAPQQPPGEQTVGVCLDTVNSLGALELPRDVVEALAGCCLNLHIKDFDIVRQPHLQGFVVEGRPAGEGRLDIPWILEELWTRMSEPNAILEQWVPAESTPAATIAKEAAWAEQSVRTLRQWIAD